MKAFVELTYIGEGGVTAGGVKGKRKTGERGEERGADFSAA